jgi:hypothetical protein
MVLIEKVLELEKQGLSLRQIGLSLGVFRIDGQSPPKGGG